MRITKDRFDIKALVPDTLVDHITLSFLKLEKKKRIFAPNSI